VKISDILRYKGTAVVTIARPNPYAICSAPGREQRRRAGRRRRRAVVGIISERDIADTSTTAARRFSNLPVSELMTASVVSCSPNDDVDSIAGGMTELRIRHMPVLSDGQLAAS